MSILDFLNESRKSETTLVVKDLSDLEDYKNQESYDQLQIYNVCNCVIDLTNFKNVKILYMLCPGNVELRNLPDKLETIYFRMIASDVKIPYKATLKSIINLSSMGEQYVDFSNLYHKYKLHNFEFAPLVRFISGVCYSLPTDYDLLESELYKYLTMKV